MTMPRPARAEELPLSAYTVRQIVTIRWGDNDMYGHVNNAVYYEYFDAALNAWLRPHIGVPFDKAEIMGVVAESGCRFIRSVSFPGEVTVGLRITHIGRTSMTYSLGVFDGAAPPEDAGPCAVGHWVDVYVERATGISTPIPDDLRAAMQAVMDAGAVSA
jgi:acyl-CoA thioester hydrolase